MNKQVVSLFHKTGEPSTKKCYLKRGLGMIKLYYVNYLSRSAVELALIKGFRI